MVANIDNGRIINWKPSVDTQDRYRKIYNFTSNMNDSDEFLHFDEEVNPSNLKFKCTSSQQFWILFRRLSKQMYRNKVRQMSFSNFALNSMFSRPISQCESTCTSFWASWSEVSSIKWETTQPRLCSTLDSASPSSSLFSTFPCCQCFLNVRA